jgi:hypothetical protein
VRLHGSWLDCCFVRIYVSDVIVHEWLPISFGDIGKDGREVGRRIVDILEGRAKGLRLVVEHSCGDKRRLWLELSAQGSKHKADAYLPWLACIDRTVERSIGIRD